MISYYDHHSQLKINVSKYHTGGKKKKDKRGNQRCSSEKVEKPIFVNPLTLVSNFLLTTSLLNHTLRS